MVFLLIFAARVLTKEGVRSKTDLSLERALVGDGLNLDSDPILVDH